MTGKNHEKSSQDKMEVLDHILSIYRENGKYETYREELEYLVLANAYFEPSKELVLEGDDGTYLQKYRDYTKSRIGNVKNNKYIIYALGMNFTNFEFLVDKNKFLKIQNKPIK